MTEREKLEDDLNRFFIGLFKEYPLQKHIEFGMIGDLADFIRENYVEKDEIFNLIKYLKKQNPYPESVFIEPSDEQMDKIHNLFKINGYPDAMDALHGSWGRHVWNMLCDKFKEELETQLKSELERE